MNYFMEYFTDREEHPSIQGEILPINTYWGYVSSSFLNGIINMISGDILSAFVAGRYTCANEEVPASFLYQETLSYLWVSVGECEKTKRQVYDIALRKRCSHTDLSLFHDDVLILRSDKNVDGQYWFFWFDMDVSDCCVGRFQTTDSKEQVVSSFNKYVLQGNELLRDLHEPWALPAHFFEGWVHF